MIWLGLWCLTPFQLYCGSQFYWWTKTGVHRENHDLLQVTDKLFPVLAVHLMPVLDLNMACCLLVSVK
jgi:hypothetical protein